MPSQFDPCLIEWIVGCDYHETLLSPMRVECSTALCLTPDALPVGILILSIPIE